MTVLETWGTMLQGGVEFAFSPSGYAMSFQSLVREPMMQTLEIHFADEREPVVFECEEDIAPRIWASEDEVIYRVWGQPLGVDATPSLRAYSATKKTSRLVCQDDPIVSMAPIQKRPGYLSVLTERQGQIGIGEWDTQTGIVHPRQEFDAMLEELEVYPSFGHSFCEIRQEVALVAWPRGDYLPEGVEPTEENSQWSPILDTPWIQDYVEVRSDGTRVTQRELTQQAKRKTPFRLFFLDASGGCQEVPGTLKAQRPQWSPDGTVLAFERFDHFDHRRVKGSIGGVWLMQRKDLSLVRLGGCTVGTSTLMHPDGVLLCHLENESIPWNLDGGKERARARRWVGFQVRGGEVGPE